jgi:hypothetical protein
MRLKVVLFFSVSEFEEPSNDDKFVGPAGEENHCFQNFIDL